MDQQMYGHVRISFALLNNGIKRVADHLAQREIAVILMTVPQTGNSQDRKSSVLTSLHNLIG